MAAKIYSSVFRRSAFFFLNNIQVKKTGGRFNNEIDANAEKNEQTANVTTSSCADENKNGWIQGGWISRYEEEQERERKSESVQKIITKMGNGKWEWTIVVMTIETRISFHFPYIFNVSYTNNICQSIIRKLQVNAKQKKSMRKRREEKIASNERQKNSGILIRQTALEYAIIHLNFDLAWTSFVFIIFQAHKLHSMFTWTHIHTAFPFFIHIRYTFDYIRIKYHL